MSLAILRRTNGWIPMLCMAMALLLAIHTTAQAFEIADHTGHHFAEAMADAVDDHDDDGGDKPADPGDKPDHHHTDHHSVGLLCDPAAAKHQPFRGQDAPPATSLMRTGLSGYGIERPPKA